MIYIKIISYTHTEISNIIIIRFYMGHFFFYDLITKCNNIYHKIYLMKLIFYNYFMHKIKSYEYNKNKIKNHSYRHNKTI